MATSIDNYLDDFTYKYIYSLVTTTNFPWYFHNYLVSPKINEINGEEKHSQKYMFVHGLKSSNPERPLSPFFDAVALPIINKLQIHYQDILRVKINLTTQHEKSLASEFHVDCNKPHQVAIYYLNTNNGFTELEDGTKINSIGNRLVVLNNGEKHRSISSTDKIRIVLNINWHEK